MVWYGTEQQTWNLCKKKQLFVFTFCKSVNLDKYSFGAKFVFFPFQKTIAKIATCLELRSAALQV